MQSEPGGSRDLGDCPTRGDEYGVQTHRPTISSPEDQAVASAGLGQVGRQTVSHDSRQRQRSVRRGRLELDKLPAPEIIAREIVEDLTAALAEFEALRRLSKRRWRGLMISNSQPSPLLR